MEILFSSKKLEKLANDYKRCQKEMGIIGAKRFHTRLLDLYAPTTLEDVRFAPGRFHELKGDRKGQYSIRINDQWRICFSWESENATGVEVVDYH